MCQTYFYRTSFLFFNLLRRDWKKLFLWISLLSFFAGGFVSSIQEIYGRSAASLQGMFETLKNPAMVALCGPTKATSKGFSIPAMYAQEMLLFTSIFFAVMSIFHVICRTRQEEEDGIKELVNAFPVGSLSCTTALLFEIVFIYVVIAGMTTMILQFQHVPYMNFSSNLLFSVSLSLQGILWGVVALLGAQLFSYATSARSFSLITLGVLYLIRMGTDLKAEIFSWFNPLSWSYLVNVYVKDNYCPLLFVVLLSLFLVGVALFLEQVRDLGGSFFSEKEGRCDARKSFLSLHGLFFRLQKPLIFSWSIGLFILGGTYGSIFEDIGNFFKKSAIIKQMFLRNSRYSLQEQFMSTLCLIFAILSTIFALSSLMKLVSEEKRDRWSQVIAMPQNRAKFYFLHVVFAGFLGIIGQILSILGLYVAQYFVMRAPISFLGVLKAGIIWIPAITFLIGILTCFIGFFPRFSFVIWGYVIFSFFVGYFDSLMKFPKILRRLDIFLYIPQLPVDTMNWESIIVVSLFSLGLILLGFVGYQRRDLILD